MNDFDCMEWEDFRAECLEWDKRKTEEALKTWLLEIGFNGTVGYEKDIGRKTIKIYSNKPGVLIGRGGKNVFILSDLLSETFNGNFEEKWAVEFVEVKGDFVTVGGNENE